MPVTQNLVECLQLSVLLIDRVGLGGHDEVVLMQILDLVRPPRDGNLAPLRRNAWMMTFFFDWSRRRSSV